MVLGIFRNYKFFPHNRKYILNTFSKHFIHSYKIFVRWVQLWAVCLCYHFVFSVTYALLWNYAQRIFEIEKKYVSKKGLLYSTKQQNQLTALDPIESLCDTSAKPVTDQLNQLEG